MSQQRVGTLIYFRALPLARSTSPKDVAMSTQRIPRSPSRYCHHSIRCFIMTYIGVFIYLYDGTADPWCCKVGRTLTAWVGLIIVLGGMSEAWIVARSGTAGHTGRACATVSQLWVFPSHAAKVANNHHQIQEHEANK